MPLTIMQGVVVGALALAVPAGGYWLGQMGSTDVRFLRGTDTTTLAGTVVGDVAHDYRVKASAGQMLEVGLDGAPDLIFEVLVPGGDAPLASGTDTADVRQSLAKGGAYTIRVHRQPDAAAAAGEQSYDLTVSLRRPAVQTPTI